MGEIADYYMEQDLLDDFYWYPPAQKARGPGKCPKCKAKTELKEGRYGKFYGCTKFPKCNGSRDYETPR